MPGPERHGPKGRASGLDLEPPAGTNPVDPHNREVGSDAEDATRGQETNPPEEPREVCDASLTVLSVPRCADDADVGLRVRSASASLKGAGRRAGSTFVSYPAPAGSRSRSRLGLVGSARARCEGRDLDPDHRPPFDPARFSAGGRAEGTFRQRWQGGRRGQSRGHGDIGMPLGRTRGSVFSAARRPVRWTRQPGKSYGPGSTVS